MLKYKSLFFAILTLCFTMIAQASDFSLKADINLEPEYAAIAGLDVQAMELVTNITNSDETAYTPNLAVAYSFETASVLEQVSWLSKPSKEFNYQTIKPMNTAKMQNQNFDRVAV